ADTNDSAQADPLGKRGVPEGQAGAAGNAHPERGAVFADEAHRRQAAGARGEAQSGGPERELDRRPADREMQVLCERGAGRLPLPGELRVLQAAVVVGVESLALLEGGDLRAV